MIKNIFLILFCFNLSKPCVSQFYYGLNSYGRLELFENNKFYFHYFDIGNDTGSYYISMDTIYLTSSVQPVYYFPVCSHSLSDSSKLINIKMKVYDSGRAINSTGEIIFKNNDLVMDTFLKMDELEQVYIRNLFLSESQLVVFDFYGLYKYIVPNNDIYNGCFDLSVMYGKRVYFNNYPMLLRDNYLFPINKEANDKFRIINGFDLLPMKMGSIDQKYRTYLSGFGDMH